MPLSKDTLKSNILKAYNDAMNGTIQFDNPPQPPPPGLSKQMAGALAKAYDDYAKQAQAGALTTIATPGLKSALEQNLTGCEDYSGWAIGVGLYWAPVMFAGGGYIPANPMLPVTVTALIVGISGEMPGYIKTTRSSVDQAAGDLATLLHSWTTKLQVTTTTTSTPPVVATATVS